MLPIVVCEKAHQLIMGGLKKLHQKKFKITIVPPPHHYPTKIMNPPTVHQDQYQPRFHQLKNRSFTCSTEYTA